MAEYNPKNMLVTGGAGFIGSNFIRYMLKKYSDIRMINLDKLTYAGSKANLVGLPITADYVFIQGDICNSSLVASILEQYSIDTIVHFAAESHVDRSIEGPGEFVQTNITGTFTLLEAAREYWGQSRNLVSNKCRFHHISTDEVFGSLENHGPAFSETTAYAPNSPYSATKAGSDYLVRAWHRTYGLPVTISHCSNNYGPYQHSEKFIPTVVRACLNQTDIPVYGDGTNIRDWLYVEDHCSAVDTLVRRGIVGQAYNIGGLNEWSNIHICQLICDLMDQQLPSNAPHRRLIQFVADRPGHDWRYAIDASKLVEQLGWSPQQTFQTGITATLDWMMQAR
ncbi:dTDP-glucose 4,6-dehydratase [SAR92 clade bacterium H231]|nr:dTDP-glucose 4,6-dehydratase [SAR92 clade bacterium H231]